MLVDETFKLNFSKALATMEANETRKMKSELGERIYVKWRFQHNNNSEKRSCELMMSFTSLGLLCTDGEYLNSNNPPKRKDVKILMKAKRNHSGESD